MATGSAAPVRGAVLPQVTVERCTDLELLNRLAGLAFGIDPDAVANTENVFLLVKVAGAPSGVFAGIRQELGFEVHTELSENCRGLAALIAARMAIRWLERHAPFQRLVSWASRDKPHVVSFARKVGFRVTIKTADRIWLELSAIDLCHWQQ